MKIALIVFCLTLSGCAVATHETRVTIKQSDYEKPPQVEATIISTY